MSLGGAIALATERIAAPVEGIHREIAGKWFSVLEPVARPVRVAHGVLSDLVYGSIRVGATALGAAIDTRVPTASAAAHTARAIVNGLWGDALGRHESLLHTKMAIHDRNGHALPDDADLAESFPAATGHLAVLVHGLVANERCWQGTQTRPGMIETLETGGAMTPIAVRYNTGLAVAMNGEALATLIESTRLRWPVPVESIVVVGHSMGGLVALAAHAAARRMGHGWIGDLTDIVTIGSPHRGAPFENLARLTARSLDAFDRTRPLAEFLDRRSRGIKDLGSGGTPQGAEHADVAGATPVMLHLVAGVTTSNPHGPIGALLGDLMVRRSSAIPPDLEPANTAVLGGVHHFGLLHEPEVLARCVEWLERA